MKSISFFSNKRKYRKYENLSIGSDRMLTIIFAYRCPWRRFTMNKAFSSWSMRRMTHLAIGQPWLDFPSLPVYKTFSIRSCFPFKPARCSISLRSSSNVEAQPIYHRKNFYCKFFVRFFLLLSYLSECNNFLAQVVSCPLKNNHSQVLPVYCSVHCRCPFVLLFYFDLIRLELVAFDLHF